MDIAPKYSLTFNGVYVLTRRYQLVRTRVFMNFLSTALLDIPGFTIS